MRIEFDVSPSARAELLAILEARSQSVADALSTAQIFIQDIEEQLLLKGEPPRGSTVVYRGSKSFWWFYVEGIWLGIRVKETSSIFRIKTRRLTLRAAVAKLPDARDLR